MFQDIIRNVQNLYSVDARPWIVGYSGGKDSTLLVSLVFEAIASLPAKERIKDVTIACTDTRVEIPPVIARVSKELRLMQTHSEINGLNISTQLLTPRIDQTFWVNIIGRGYPPPNRTFRWCTQRLKIDPVSELTRSKIGHWGEVIILLGARTNESGSRAQTMGSRSKNELGLRRHDDLPRGWIYTPIEHLSTQNVWDYLLGGDSPWGGDNDGLFQLYKDAAGGECPMVLDQSTPACGNSRFGCWTCTVVEKDKASEGLLASGESRMGALLSFRDTLIQYREFDNGYRDNVRKNGQDGPGPLTVESRKALLNQLLAVQKEVGYNVISEDELYWIQTYWKSSRKPDNGNGVANIILNKRSETMNEAETERTLANIAEEVALEKGVQIETLKRLVAKVDEYSESHRAQGLPDELLQILEDDLREIVNSGERNV